MTTYAPPSPPLAEGELKISVHRLRIDLVRGRCAGCCICNGSCFTWWSAAPPSSYVPLHDHCAPRLIERWRQMLVDGDIEPDAFRAPPSERRGAYARRASTVPDTGVATPPVRLATGAVLPEGFIPGPFWLPGDDEHTPWTGLLETTAGLTVCPAGANRAHAEETYRFYETRRQINFGPVVVGGALFAPDGAVTASWGSVPSPEGPRWVSIKLLSDWTRCLGCSDLRWPGSWVTVEGTRCPECQAQREVEDPREWPSGAGYPGDAAIPELFTKVKRIRLPASAARKFTPNLRTGFASPNSKG